jgi:hypothetical protein
MMEASPVVSPRTIVVSEDDEDPEEVIPEEEEQDGQQDQEERVPGSGQDDHHKQVGKMKCKSKLNSKTQQEVNQLKE